MKNLFLVGLLIACLPGCTAVPPYDEVDYGKTADGKTYLRDTQRTWSVLSRETDEAIARELKGKPPGGAMKSWNENWLRVIGNIREGKQENPEKYVAYIVEQRRRAGLHEIVSPEPEKSSNPEKPNPPPTKKNERSDTKNLFGGGS